MAKSLTNSQPSIVESGWRSWSNFWFTPRDPSTLGFMRVVAGIFIVYTHLAYSVDLQEFFGEHAWVDIGLANSYRHELPVFKPSSEWEDAPPNINLPQETISRRAFLDWMRELPLDRNRRIAALEYLKGLPLDNRGENGFAFAQNLLIHPIDERKQGRDYDAYVETSESERNKLLDELVDPPPDAKKTKRIPDHLLDLRLGEKDDVRREARLATRQQLEALLATMPKEPGKISRIFGYLASQFMLPLPHSRYTDPPTEFHRTLNFLDEHLRDTEAERNEIIDYLDRWGVDPDRAYARGQYFWSIWFHVTDPTAMAIVHCIFIAIMVMFAFGLFTRVTSVLTWFAALCYIHRSNQVLFGMDTMMNINMIYLMIAPSGATFSLDRWLAKRRAQRVIRGEIPGDAAAAKSLLLGPAPSVAANFATRLFQVHFCFIYLASGFAKLKGALWWTGQATWLTIANPEFSPLVFGPYRWVLNFLAEHRLLWEIVMSSGVIFTLMVEIGFPFLVWNAKLRPYVLVAAILLHAGIAIFMGLTVFSILMMVLLMAFIPPVIVRRWAESGGSLFQWPFLKT